MPDPPSPDELAQAARTLNVELTSSQLTECYPGPTHQLAHQLRRLNPSHRRTAGRSARVRPGRRFSSYRFYGPTDLTPPETTGDGYVAVRALPTTQ